MSRATILTVDDDPMVSAAIARDLRTRYGADYRVVRASSGAEGVEVVRRLLLRDEPVALVCADQRMPGMSGIELLAQVRDRVPDAKLLGKAWIVILAMLLAFLLPATQELCNRINVRPMAWVPAVIGVIGLGILVQLGGNEPYDFIYFRF